jgi:hypothetical protein
VSPLSLPTFFAAAKKVGAAPHRGEANRPITNQGEANAPRKQPGAKQTDQKQIKEKPTRQEQPPKRRAGKKSDQSLAEEAAP